MTSLNVQVEHVDEPSQNQSMLPVPTMRSAESTQLWSQFIQENDIEAFNRLYKAYRYRVFRYCFLRLGDRDFAEEIPDRVFTFLWRNRPACTVSFESLLFYYARLRCNDNRRPQPKYELLGSLQVNHADGHWIARPHQRDEEREGLAASFAALDPIERTVVTLVHYVELDWDTIEEVTGIRKWTLRRRYKGALKKMRSFLKET